MINGADEVVKETQEYCDGAGEKKMNLALTVCLSKDQGGYIKASVNNLVLFSAGYGIIREIRFHRFQTLEDGFCLE